MARPKVFVTRVLPQEGLQPVLEAAQAEVWEDELPPPYEVLVEKIQGVEGLLCLLTDRIDSDLIAAGPSLKVISQMAVGYDNIDVEAATARGIPVGHTPGVLTEATADFTWALIMAAARRVAEAERHVRRGRWVTWGPTLLLGADLAGATLGIIGLGRIGQAVARRAAGFDMRILYWSGGTRRPQLEQDWGLEHAALEALLAEADFVSLHTPLTDATRHLIGADELALMKPSAILVNTARGPIVDPEALYRALESGAIAAAALDVTDPEPISLNDPLLQLDNLIVTPHIASASRGARGRMASMAAENLIAGLHGEPLPHCVNPQIYSTG